jgi:tetratricopeptide (TPR) repeat protein
MKPVIPRLVCGGVAWIVLSAVGVGASWSDATILPKKLDLQLQKSPASRATVGGVNEIAWPAKVQKIDGQWLQIADEGGYGAKPLEGWVRKGDAVKIGDAQGFFTDKIRELNGDAQKAAGFYWLRGIFWENQGEIESAIADYKAAKCLNSGGVHLHLGRALTTLAGQQVDVDPQQAVKTVDLAICQFKKARELYDGQAAKQDRVSKKDQASKKCPPQLFVSWGDAYFERYRAMKLCNDAITAIAKYGCAETLNGSWFAPSYGQGKLLLLVFRKTKNADKKTLLAAIQCFTQSIRLSPNEGDTYRARADALRRLAIATGLCDKIDCGIDEFSSKGGARPEIPPCHPGKASENVKHALLYEASQSAHRAYVLGNNREPKSLAVVAAIEVEIAKTHFPGPTPTKPVNAKKRAQIALAQSLFESAGGLMQASADRGRDFDEINCRLALAAEWKSTAIEYLNYLNGKDTTDYAAIVMLIDGFLRAAAEKQKDLAAIKGAEGVVDRVREARKDILRAAEHPTAANKKVARAALAELTDSVRSQARQLPPTAKALFSQPGFRAVEPENLAVKLRGMLSRRVEVSPTYTPMFLDVPP